MPNHRPKLLPVCFIPKHGFLGRAFIKGRIGLTMLSTRETLEGQRVMVLEVGQNQEPRRPILENDG